MKFIDIIRMSIGNLRRNRMRTILTILGVTIGIGAIVFLVSIGFGLQNLSKQRITTLEALTVIEVRAGQGPEHELTKEAVEKFQAINGVKGVSVAYYLTAKATIKGSEIQARVIGIDPKFQEVEDISVTLGKPLQDPNNKEAIVSRATLKIFELTEASEFLGKEISLDITVLDKEGKVVEVDNPATKQKLKIVGITAEDKSNYIYMPINLLQPLNLETYNSVKVKVDSKEKVKPVRQTIESLGYPTTSIEETVAQIDKIFLIIKLILGGFGMIALLVASIGIFNTMTIALLERTHEIGIMKAIGATDSDIKKMFIVEAATIGLVGGIFGVIGGYLGALLTNALVNFLAVTFGGQAYKLFEVPLWFAVGSIVFSFFVSTIAGIYPARRASKLNPIEALRYE